MVLLNSRGRSGNFNRNVMFTLAALLLLVIGGVIVFQRSRKATPPDVAVANLDAEQRKKQNAETKNRGLSNQTEVSPETKTVAGKSTASSKKRTLMKGRVLKAADDTPISGALVQTVKVAFDSHEKLEPIESVRTDANGAFEIHQPVSDLGDVNLPALAASAEGFESQRVLLGGDDTPEYVFRLGVGATITGRVIDESNTSIAGALISTNPLGGSDVFNMGQNAKPAVFASSVSGADGTFTLSGLSQNQSYKLSARAARYQPLLSDEKQSGATGVELVLKHGTVRLHGTITSADKKPFAGASVQVMPQNETGGNIMEIMTKLQRSTTNAKGEYEFEGLAAGNMIIIVMKSAQNPAGGMANRMVTLKQGDDKVVDIEFPAPLVLRGRAVNDETNLPVVGVKVSSDPLSGGTVLGFKMPGFSSKSADKSVLTGGDGTFTLTDVAPMGPGAMVYYQTPPGMTAVSLAFGEGVAMANINEKGVLMELVLHFRPALRLAGTVYLSKSTTPATDVSISAVGENNFRKTAHTDKAGKFFMEVPPSGDLRVTASSETGSVSEQVTIPKVGKPADLVLTLKNFASITGSVKDSAGNPVKGITVAKTQTANADPFAIMQQMMGAQGPTAISGADGTFSLTKVEPGSFEIAAQKNNPMFSTGSSTDAQKYAKSNSVPVTVDEGEQKTGVEIIMNVGETIDGIVTNEEKTPVVGASIMYFGSQGWPQNSTKTDAEGKFKIEGMEEKQTVSLQITHPDYASLSRTNVGPEDSPVEVVLLKRPEVTLEVTYRSGAAVKDYKYQVMRSMGKATWLAGMDLPSTEVHGATDGTTTLEKIEQGSYRVEVSELVETGGSGRIGSAEFKIEKTDRKSTVKVELDNGRKIRGTVIRGENGPPIQDAEISASRLNRALSQMQGMTAPPALTAKTDGAGKFTLEPVLPGEIEISVTAEGLYTKEKVYVTVPSDSDPADITIILVEATSVFGKVIGFDGSPVVGARLELQAEYRGFNYFQRDDHKEAVTDKSGAYRFDALAPSPYIVSMESDVKDVRGSENIDTSEGNKELNFDFSSYITLSGVITVNGQPTTPDKYTFYSQEEGGGGQEALTIDATGAYRTSMKPGKYSVYVQRTGTGGGGWTNSLIANLTVTETPQEQVQNFNLQFVDATVALVFPKESDFVTGVVSIARANFANGVAPGASATAEKANVPFKDLIPGEYKATFTGQNEWYGTSETVSLAPGSDNILVIDVKKPPFKKRVGEWKLSSSAKTSADYDIDVTPYVTAGGRYDVIYMYESGSEALSIDSTTLLENGAVVGTDAHIGWSGMSKRDNVYTFPLGDTKPGATYTLRCRYKAAGSSSGGIFLARY